jgi:hypothetical protein
LQFVLNLISFSAIKVPAWNKVGEVVSGGLSSVGLAHFAFGGLTMLASFWALGLPSSLQSDKLRCYDKFNKRIIIIVTVLWLAALIVLVSSGS